MFITKPENVLKTYANPGKIQQKGRFSSAIIEILCGKIDFVFGDTIISCDKNHAIFVPAGAHYHLVCHEYVESIQFNFKTSENHPPQSVNSAYDSNLKDIFDKLQTLLIDRNHHVNEIFSLYYQVLSKYFDTKKTLSKTEKYVADAENIILNNYSSPDLSCKTIADKINISEVYLRKLFIKHRGKAPKKYLSSFRMKKAKLYLSEGCSVSECATNVGYSDIYQFSRAFKRHFGFSPSNEYNR